MKITVVCGSYSSSGSAAAMKLIRSLRAGEHEVIVIRSDAEKRGRKGCAVTLPDSSESKHSIVVSSGNIETLMEPVIWDSDAVHITQPDRVGAAAMRLANKHLIPVTADFSAEALPRLSGGKSSLSERLEFRRLCRGFYSRADALRFPSELSLSLYKSITDSDMPCFVIPDPAGRRFVPREVEKPLSFRDKLIIVSTCGFLRENRLDVLIDAAAMSAHSREIQLICAGEGPLGRELEERAKKLPNAPVIAGFPYSQMPALLNYADIYVNPAETAFRADGFIEALACGTPSIVSDSERSAARELISFGGKLFKNGDPADLAEKLDLMIGELPELRKAPGNAADIEESFSEEAFCGKMEEMLYSVR